MSEVTPRIRTVRRKVLIPFVHIQEDKANTWHEFPFLSEQARVLCNVITTEYRRLLACCEIKEATPGRTRRFGEVDKSL